MNGFLNWRTFGVLWLGGLGILMVLLSVGSELYTEAAPRGILDHQSAGTAARIDEIQKSWAAIGKLSFAKYAMAADLVFIGLYSLGGVLGGWLVWSEARSSSLRRVGALSVAAYLLFGLLDYGETLSQFAQLLAETGNDSLAAIAANLQPPKFVAFAVSIIAMPTALIWRAWENRRQSVA